MIIGIGNKSRQGKDVVAEYLVKQYGFKLLRFASYLYEECNRLPDYIDKWNANYVWVKSESGAIRFHRPPFVTEDLLSCGMQGMKNGFLLQWWGAEVRRSQDKNYWTNKIQADIVSGGDRNIVIPDTRMTNELKLIKELSGKFVSIERFKLNGKRYVTSDRDPNHSTEIELDNINYDYLLVNDGTLDDLYEKTDTMIINLRNLEGKYEKANYIRQ